MNEENNVTDRELLELAAKAEGNITFDDYTFIHRTRYSANIWQPLDSDGDAFRLAVKLNLHMQANFQDGYDFAVAGWENPDHHQDMDTRESLWVGEAAGKDDPCATMRRAIVLAAAEIGKAMS